MKKLMRMLLVAATLSSASSAPIFAAVPAPAANAAIDLSPFIKMRVTPAMLAMPDVKIIFSHDCNGFLNLILQLHYHWTKAAVKSTPQFLQEYQQASDAEKLEMLTLWQAQSDDLFKKFLGTPQAQAFLKSLLPRYGWQSELHKIGILRMRRSQIQVMDMVAWKDLSAQANLMVNTQKLELYNPETHKAALANLPVPPIQQAPDPDPVRLAEFEASGELSEHGCGVDVVGCVGGVVIADVRIPAEGDVDAIAHAVKKSFRDRFLSPDDDDLEKEVAKLRLDDDDEKTEN